jgi:hypothetical protein
MYQLSIPIYSCIQDWTRGGEGNIPDDPKFAEGSYRLSLDSPCIDTGRNEDWMWEAVDLAGNVRIFYGISSLTVDMGAYEYDSFRFKIIEVLKADRGAAELTWISRPGDTYSIWSCADLGGEWKEQATVPSQGEATNWIDPETASTRKFYRIEVK